MANSKIASPAEPAAPESEPLARGVVARGRSMLMNDPSGEIAALRHHPESATPIPIRKQIVLMPGDVFIGSESEVRRLRELGALHDPDKFAPADTAPAA